MTPLLIPKTSWPRYQGLGARVIGETADGYYVVPDRPAEDWQARAFGVSDDAPEEADGADAME